jgi:beta-fructofuranosidase
VTALALRLAEHWVWDSWVADDGALFHLFFLKAPRTLGDPELRHTAATIGHATSEDLTHWEVHEDALTPAPRGWDDLALWTGSVARGDDGVWRLYYTGLATGDGVRFQRIGLAESADLFGWRRVGERPLVVPDPRWYSAAAWRDPFVLRDPDGDGWHMLICARVAGAPRRRDAALAHARSADMRAWELQPPLTAPAGFGQLEVPQARMLDGQPVLLFTCHPDEQATPVPCSTWTVPAPSVTGPFDIAAARPLTDHPDLFAAQLVQRRDGTWALLGFCPRGPGSLAVLDPIGVALRGGRLVSAAR